MSMFINCLWWNSQQQLKFLQVSNLWMVWPIRSDQRSTQSISAHIPFGKSLLSLKNLDTACDRMWEENRPFPRETSMTASITFRVGIVMRPHECKLFEYCSQTLPNQNISFRRPILGNCINVLQGWLGSCEQLPWCIHQNGEPSSLQNRELVEGRSIWSNQPSIKRSTHGTSGTCTVRRKETIWIYFFK